MRIDSVISAQNCQIEFNGVECGSLQGLTINSQYNLQEVDNLFQHRLQNYVQGIAKYKATAGRAFVTLDTIFGNIKDVFALTNQVRTAEESWRQATSSGDILDYFTAISKTWEAGIDIFNTGRAAVDQVVNAIRQKDDVKKIDIYDFMNMLTFDIVVKSPAIEFPDFMGARGIADTLLGGGDVLKLTRCRVNSRNLEIKATNIIVMENLEILGIDFEDFNSRTQAQHEAMARRR